MRVCVCACVCVFACVSTYACMRVYVCVCFVNNFTDFLLIGLCFRICWSGTANATIMS